MRIEIRNFFPFNLSTMSKISVNLDKWRDYFSSADSDIFSIIEHAIMVAASDCPYDFKKKRDRIAELLFTCNRAEFPIQNGDGEVEYKNGERSGGSKDSKESKAISNSGVDNDDDDDGDGDDHAEDDVETNVENRNVENRARDREYDDAEALTDEIEEESQLLEEVVRIRGILDEREEKVCFPHCFCYLIWFSFLFFIVSMVLFELMFELTVHLWCIELGFVLNVEIYEFLAFIIDVLLYKFLAVIIWKFDLIVC